MQEEGAKDLYEFSTPLFKRNLWTDSTPDQTNEKDFYGYNCKWHIKTTL